MKELNDEWLTVKEATAYLKCSKPTLYRYIKAGKITRSRIVGKTLLNKQSILNALQAK